MTVETNGRLTGEGTPLGGGPLAAEAFVEYYCDSAGLVATSLPGGR